MARNVPQIQVGCSGFALAQEKYFRAFSCVEVDASFYQLPRIETVRGWRAAAPPGFQFSLKAWQVITHPASSPTYQRTRIDPRDAEQCGHFGYAPTIRWAWDQTFQVAAALGVFLVLFQCPASFRPTRENAERVRMFFERAKRGKFLMGWEPRGEWPPELIASLCRDLDLIHVVDPFRALPVVVGKIRYYRLHGVTGFRHRFRDEELLRLRTEFCAGRTPTYCLWNNVSRALDARRFARLR